MGCYRERGIDEQSVDLRQVENKREQSPVHEIHTTDKARQKPNALSLPSFSGFGTCFFFHANNGTILRCSIPCPQTILRFYRARRSLSSLCTTHIPNGGIGSPSRNKLLNPMQ